MKGHNWFASRAQALVTLLTVRGLQCVRSSNLSCMGVVDLLYQIGPVAYVRILQDSNRESRGMGIVEYEDSRDTR